MDVSDAIPCPRLIIVMAVSSVVRTGPDDAVAVHRQRVAESASVHGPPLKNRSMADLLERDATYRERHGGATMRRPVYGWVACTAIVVLATAWVVLRIVVTDG